MNTTGVILTVLALSTGLSACASSHSAGSDAPATQAFGLPRGELAARANAICATALPRIGAIKVPGTLGSDATAAAAYFDQVFPIADRETKDIQALTPAADAAAGWRAFVAALLAFDQLTQTLKQKADAKDPSGLAYLAETVPAARRIADAAAKIGARTCAGTG